MGHKHDPPMGEAITFLEQSPIVTFHYGQKRTWHPTWDASPHFLHPWVDVLHPWVDVLHPRVDDVLHPWVDDVLLPPWVLSSRVDVLHTGVAVLPAGIGVLHCRG